MGIPPFLDGFHGKSMEIHLCAWMNMDDLEVPLFQETSKYFLVKIRYPVSS
jgi:hypothetical protein